MRSCSSSRWKNPPGPLISFFQSSKIVASEAMKEHRFQSEALPSNLAGQSIWSEEPKGSLELYFL